MVPKRVEKQHQALIFKSSGVVVSTSVTAYIALGANLGEPGTMLLQAMESIGGICGTALVRASSLYRTEPIESTGPDYVNAVVEVLTELAPLDLLAQLQQLEQRAGRERPYHNAPRTLDLDLLLYGDWQVNGPTLVVPHPRMWERAFVLVPLAEIAPHCVTTDQLHAVQDQAIHRFI